MTVGPADETVSLQGWKIETKLPRERPESSDADFEEVLKERSGTQRFSLVSLLSATQTKGDAGGGAPEGEEEKYDVRTEVGRGGMGKILEVRDNDLNRDVAMKVLLRDDTGRFPHLRRFIEEAQITGQLEHPNVLPVHDLGVNGGGDLFFTMQYVKGHQTLRDVIDRLREGDELAHETFTFERRAQIVQQVCHALHYAHRRGVVHRDLKPDNIILGTFGEVYVVDWGVAKVLTEEELLESANVDDVLNLESDPIETVNSKEEFEGTQEGSWIGTPAYMSPEQVLGKNQDVRPTSDVYGLSAVLYELLTLHHYLEGPQGQTSQGGSQGLNEMIASVLTRKPLDAETFLHPTNGRVPRHLSRICRKGLEKRPRNRWQSTDELATALQHWIEGRAPIVCPGTFIQSQLSRLSAHIDRHPVGAPVWIIIFSAVLVIGLVLAVVGIVLRV